MSKFGLIFTNAHLENPKWCTFGNERKKKHHHWRSSLPVSLKIIDILSCTPLIKQINFIPRNRSMTARAKRLRFIGFSVNASLNALSAHDSWVSTLKKIMFPNRHRVTILWLAWKWLLKLHFACWRVVYGCEPPPFRCFYDKTFALLLMKLICTYAAFYGNL